MATGISTQIAPPRKPPRWIIKGEKTERGVWRTEELNQFRAWILLGINCGFSAADCEWIEVARLDIDGTWDGDGWQGWDPDSWQGWHHYPRRKTERYNTPRPARSGKRPEKPWPHVSLDVNIAS